MAESELNLYRKQQRRDNTSKKRQATFISEYVFIKYFNIYQEAAELFNQINVIHPKKPDLRRSIEFKNWKRELMGLPKIRPSQKRDPANHPSYQNISFGQPHNETHDVQYVPEGVNDNAALAQIVQSLPKKTMQLRIPLISPPQAPKTSPQEETTVNNDQVLDEVLDEGDIECLMPEEGITVNNDEVLGVEPSLFEDISPDMMGELLAELQADPNIATIMDDFETSFGDFNIDQQLELGMEVEIDDRLERELEDTLLL